MSSVALAGLAMIVLTGACSAAPTTTTSADRSNGDRTPGAIAFTCMPATGAEVEQADRICVEVLDALQAARPDLRFVAGGPAAPAAQFQITQGNALGLGLEATWVDARGARTVGKPMSVTFFDRNSDPELRRSFYAVFLRENPIPF